MFLSLILVVASAEAASASEVILFGGAGSTQADMTCWQQSASGKANYAGYKFRGVPYPANKNPGKETGIAAGASIIESLAREINSNPLKRYVIAGHSWGSSLSTRLAELVKNLDQIELVDLDGTAPPVALQNKVKTTCVYGINKRNGVQSRNASLMKGSCLKSKGLEDARCETSWCLHFAILNTSTPAKLNGSDFATQGYSGCTANLDWLTPLPGRILQPAHAPQIKEGAR